MDLARLLQDTANSDGVPYCVEPPLEEVSVSWQQYVFLTILAIMSGMFSGLNLGLLGLDVKNLELLTRGPFNDEDEAKTAEYANKILPIRRRGNLLLCTILLGNVTVNSGLAILMGDLTSGLMGLLISTSIITIFGEIIP
jgi:metal transporter CNNM